MLIDTHCHLNFKAFKKDLKEVIERAKMSGVEKIIVPGAKINSSQKACAIAQEYENIYAAVGVHPHHANEEIDLEEIRHLASLPKTVAIGEIGLDHHQYKNYPEISDTDKKSQVSIFLDQLKIACDFNKPVIVHCREAQSLILTTIKDFMEQEGRIRGVFHCFEGNKKHLNEVLDLGFYIGFDGNITYPENRRLREILSLVPSDRLLLETDAPFLTPQNYRGKRNEPGFLADTLEFVSHHLGVTPEKLASQTSLNAQSLFFG